MHVTATPFSVPLGPVVVVKVNRLSSAAWCGGSGWHEGAEQRMAIIVTRSTPLSGLLPRSPG